MKLLFIAGGLVATRTAVRTGGGRIRIC